VVIQHVSRHGKTSLARVGETASGFPVNGVRMKKSSSCDLGNMVSIRPWHVGPQIIDRVVTASSKTQKGIIEGNGGYMVVVVDPLIAT
jgi:hypothetical protein